MCLLWDKSKMEWKPSPHSLNWHYAGQVMHHTQWKQVQLFAWMCQRVNGVATLQWGCCIFSLRVKVGLNTAEDSVVNSEDRWEDHWDLPPLHPGHLQRKKFTNGLQRLKGLLTSLLLHPGFDAHIYICYCLDALIVLTHYILYPSLEEIIFHFNCIFIFGMTNTFKLEMHIITADSTSTPWFWESFPYTHTKTVTLIFLL